MPGRAGNSQKYKKWTQHSPTAIPTKIIVTTVVCAAIGLSTAGAQNLTQPEITPLEERAAKYIEFRNDVQMIDVTPIDSALVSRDAHNRLASHTPEDLSSGWMAYAALVAADTPSFVASVRKRVKRPKDRAQFLSELRTNPRSVRSLSGSQAAVEAVLMMAAKDATKIKAVGERYISDAYAMQNKGWAKKKLGSDGTSRLSEAESYAYSRARMSTPVLPASMDAGVRQPGLSTSPNSWTPSWSSVSAYPSANPRATPIMDRILVLATRYAVGDLTAPIVNGYAKSESSRRCHNTAKLNLDQCIAATRTSTEEVFCIGKHGLGEVSGCVGWVAGAGGN